MKIYTIEVCALGTYWEYDVNCPWGWHGSGVYDVQHEIHQEANFDVVAESLDQALKEIWKNFEHLNNDGISYDICTIFYDPNSVKEKDVEDDEGETEIFAWEYEDPKDGFEHDPRYCAEM